VKEASTIEVMPELKASQAEMKEKKKSKIYILKALKSQMKDTKP